MAKSQRKKNMVKRLPRIKKQEKPPKRVETIEEKLFGIIGDREPTSGGPRLFDENVFAITLHVCSEYLAFNKHSEASRHKIAEMAFAFRIHAMKQFGHDTVETFALAKLLKPQIESVRIGRPDVVSHIMKLPNVLDRLDAEEETASEWVKKVWEAMGKGLMGGGRDFARVGNSGLVLHPLDQIDEELWNHYKRVYVPWHCRIARIFVARRTTYSVTCATIVFKCLVEDIYPEQLDRMFELDQGSCLKVLKRSLKKYWLSGKPDLDDLARGDIKPRGAVTRGGAIQA